MPANELVGFYVTNYLHCLYFEFEIGDFKIFRKSTTELLSPYSL